MTAVNASAAALFRSVAGAEARPTILFDEIDTVFGPKAGDNEELRGFINAGHRRSGVTYRCIGDGGNQTVQAFPSYCARGRRRTRLPAGHDPHPLASSSACAAAPATRRVEPFRQRLHTKQGHALRDQLAKWAEAVRPLIDGVFPELPSEVTDRPADVWEPLSPWPTPPGATGPNGPARPAPSWSRPPAPTTKAALGIRLLTDLRDQVLNGIDRLPTVAVLERLHQLDESPWADMGGRPLDARGLAKLLREYMTSDNTPIQARNIKTGAGVLKGYYAADLTDAWARPPPTPQSPLLPLPPLPPSSQA